MEDTALPLSELRERIPSSTFQWLLKEEETALAAAAEEEEAEEATAFFQVEEEEDETWIRVQEWRSSKTTADGIGGYIESEEPKTVATDTKDDELVVYYILSQAGGGHGDDLWAASRHVANQLADAETCRDLLSPLDSNEEHPLVGLRFLELGAGAGLPSWTAMWRGAKVICTDQGIPDRIRCMAESAQRNWRAMNDADNNSSATLANAQMAQVCPYDWGTPTTEITNAALSGDVSCDDEVIQFDVIVAADCVYMPQCHEVLLKSIDLLLSASGVALLPFALHGNTQDEEVWRIVELAEEKGFRVEKLGSLQLTPQAYGLELKRALVHMLRFTRRS